MKEDGTLSKRGYCMAQFSKFIRRGYKRVDATENPNNGVYVSAYTGDGKAVIVAVNSGSSDCSQSFTIKGKTLKNVDRYRTSGSENLARRLILNFQVMVFGRIFLQIVYQHLYVL